MYSPLDELLHAVANQHDASAHVEQRRSSNNPISRGNAELMNDYFLLDGARSALETGTLRAEQGKS